MSLNRWWHMLAVVTIAIAVGLGLGLAPAVAHADDGSASEAEPTPAADTSANGDEAPLVNSLKWTTASEVDNFGFDIYRATSEDGPFERMTKEPLPGAGTIDEPQRYEWVDDTIDPEQDYWYYIESISIDNIRERFSPVIRAPAKRPKAAAAEDEAPDDAE